MENGSASKHKPVEKILLSRRRGITVEKYRELEAKQDREELAAFLRDRFCERYIDPQLAIPQGNASGFATLGLSCLVIEGLEAFRQGWKATDDKKEEPFKLFFDAHDAFAELREPFAAWFYRNIRCGILHIGETKHGWLIRYNDLDPLFDKDSLTVNAKRFVEELRAAICDYTDQLKNASWDGDLWTAFRTRMKATIDACHPPQEEC